MTKHNEKQNTEEVKVEIRPVIVYLDFRYLVFYYKFRVKGGKGCISLFFLFLSSSLSGSLFSFLSLPLPQRPVAKSLYFLYLSLQIKSALQSHETLQWQVPYLKKNHKSYPEHFCFLR